MFGSESEAGGTPHARSRDTLAGERRRAERLAALMHHRWAVPVLAELHRSHGSKFASLLVALGISRESLTRALAALIRDGWVTRNPGYGHPLRPEYLLTRKGRRLASLCCDVEASLHHVAKSMAELRQLEDAVLRKWSLPVLFVLAGGTLRFSELRAMLPGTTARALALTLKELESAGLIVREVTNQYPPATLYALSTRREDFHDAICRLGRQI